jgi:hypothetical protein
MNFHTIILAQSVTGAVITIVLLLLVAVIIGYLTAWFYSKSIYTPIVKGLEERNAALNKEISGLKDDITGLNRNIEGLNGRIADLEKKVSEKEAEIEKLGKQKV